MTLEHLWETLQSVEDGRIKAKEAMETIALNVPSFNGGYAVLGGGWRDARKESPEKNIYTSAIIAIYSSESGNKWVTEGRYDGWSGYWEDVRNGTVGIEGDNLTVYAWMPLPDPPAFA